MERGLGQLIDVLGLEWVRGTPVLTEADLQDLLNNQPIAAADLAQRLAVQFPFPLTGIQWVEEVDIAGEIAAGYAAGDPAIGLVPQQPSQTPQLRTALVIRCLCEHAFATCAELQALNPPPALAVDLLSVLAGLGLFPANSTFQEKSQRGGGFDSWVHQRQVFMPSRLFGYAMAVHNDLCDGERLDLAPLLRLDAQEPYLQGQKFLRKQRPVCWDSSRDTLRSCDRPLGSEAIVRQLRDREPAVQIDGLCEISEHRLTDAAILQEIGHLVHDRSDAVREEAIRTIIQLDIEAEELGEALILLCDDSTPRVRSLAACALGELSHPPADAVETLRQLTRDAEPIVNVAAAESLLGFPEGLENDRARLFRVLRQQLARCKYESVDRFMSRLSRSAVDAASLIEQEFAATEDETWRHLLLESVAGQPAGESR